MKIIKEGEVLFRNGKIVSVSKFEVKCDDDEAPYYDSLNTYIKNNYVFKGKPCL